MKQKSNIKAAKGVDLPNLRYIDDYLRLIKEMEVEVDDLGKLAKQQQKLLSNTLINKATPVKAALTSIDITPSDAGEQRKTVRKLKTRIDPNIGNVQVPELKKLQTQYGIAEDLYDKHKMVEAMETELSLKFPTRRGEAYEDTIASLARMKAKIAEHLKTTLDFLSSVANKHVPTTFVKYVSALATLVEEHCIYKDSHSFMYVSVDNEGFLVFTNYLMLTNAVNDEGEIAPHLYVSVQWHLSEEPSMSIDLNHEYELPNKLLGSGEKVGSVGEAARALSDMLNLESFSSALGVVPLALQLKVEPENIKSEMFHYRDVIDKILVDEHSIGFKLRKEVNTDAFQDDVAYKLWQELKVLLKSKGVKLTYSPAKLGNQRVLTFKIVEVAKSGGLNTTDLEFLRDKFGLNTSSLNRIARIINGGG